jgi:hypothetical protein
MAPAAPLRRRRGTHPERRALEARQAVAHGLIRTVGVTAAHVDSHDGRPFDGAPQGAEGPGSTPEGTPGHVYRWRVAHFHLRADARAAAHLRGREREAVGGVVRGAVADHPYFQASAYAANGRPVGVVPIVPHRVSRAPAMLLQTAPKVPPLGAHPLQEGSGRIRRLKEDLRWPAA